MRELQLFPLLCTLLTFILTENVIDYVNCQPYYQSFEYCFDMYPKGNNDYNDLHVALLVFEFQWLIWCYNIWYHMQKTPILNVEVLFENTGII